MKLNLHLPKMSTFWAAVIIAAVGVVVYAVHQFIVPKMHYVQPAAFLLVVIAFVLLCLGLTVKGL